VFDVDVGSTGTGDNGTVISSPEGNVVVRVCEPVFTAGIIGLVADGLVLVLSVVCAESLFGV